MFAYLDGDFLNKAVTYTGRQIERSQECGQGCNQETLSDHRLP
jgi:hypothetical protein